MILYNISTKSRNKFYASLLQNFIAIKWKTLGTQHMKNTLEWHDFWIEDTVPVLLGQSTPTDEQVCVGTRGREEGGWSNI